MKASIGIRVVALVGLAALVALWSLAVTATWSPARGQTLMPAIRLLITPEQVKVGQEVVATAQGLPPGRTLDLSWETVEGGWVVEEYYYFKGKKYVESTLPLGRFRVGADGRLNARFVIPEDWGGVHNVVALEAGRPVAEGAVDVVQSFELWPSSGPIGTPIELRVKGLGWRTMESTWVVNWDNSVAGFVSAAGTRGSATARFRATGPIGPHMVKVYTGYMGQAYLNHEQAPNAYLPRPDFTFYTTPGEAPPTMYAEPYALQPLPASVPPPGGWFGISPTQGTVGSQATLRGAGFPAGEPLILAWQTMVGSRVSGNGFAPEETILGRVLADDRGGLLAAVTVPEDLGGRHALIVRQGDVELARTYFAIETSIVGMSPAAGPAGTVVSIHLKGVGWTEYDNIYTATYDNNYMGYACGFNSQGDVVINFTASGAPGVHVIDLYPGIYQGPPAGQQLYRIPQLTYADDHPGNIIPALRFAFTITE
ncbi:MAG TPA: hypothetical protein VFX49_22995 [Chloroflexota bacterium]|nr:hypothetical protein [Chloroflexota bacterium]